LNYFAAKSIAPIQARVVLSYLLLGFEVSTPQKREDVKMVYAVSADPCPAILLGFKPRNRSDVIQELL
jgi:hypothetical protein